MIVSELMDNELPSKSRLYNYTIWLTKCDYFYYNVLIPKNIYMFVKHIYIYIYTVHGLKCEMLLMKESIIVSYIKYLQRINVLIRNG